MRGKLKFILAIPCIAAVLAFLGWLVMSLWNWVMPELFATARPIDFQHAIGLLILSRILFGGLRGGGWRGRHGHARGHWRRWQQMTPEEREQFKRGGPVAREQDPEQPW